MVTCIRGKGSDRGGEFSELKIIDRVPFLHWGHGFMWMGGKKSTSRKSHKRVSYSLKNIKKGRIKAWRWPALKATVSTGGVDLLRWLHLSTFTSRKRWRHGEEELNICRERSTAGEAPLWPRWCEPSFRARGEHRMFPGQVLSGRPEWRR